MRKKCRSAISSAHKMLGDNASKGAMFFVNLPSALVNYQGLGKMYLAVLWPNQIGLIVT
jgi:hypothetical protein